MDNEIIEEDILDLPELELEKYEVPTAIEEEVKDETTGSLKFALIGAGQCGAKLAQSFYNIGYKKTIAVNTSTQDLNLIEIPKNQKLLMDIGEQGAGKNPQKGKDAADKYKNEIFDLCKKVFSSNIDHIMVVAGAGGGTGCGSIIPLIKIAKEYMGYIGVKNPEKHVGAVVTLPTYGEANSHLVAKNAYKLMTDLGEMMNKKEFSPLIIIDNDKIHKLYKGLTMAEYWPKINNTVAGLFDIFNRLSAKNSSYTSFDPADYKTIIQEFGCTIMGVTSVTDFSTEQSISSAVKNNLTKTLLADGFDLTTAKVAGSIAVAGKNIMQTCAGLADNLNYGFDTLSNLCNGATVHRGIYQGPRESLSIYTIVGGMALPMSRLNQLKSKIMVKTTKDNDFNE